MKKLMTMLAAAAMAFGLYADPVDPGFLSGTAFEGISEDGGNSYDADFVTGYWAGIGSETTTVVSVPHDVQKSNRPKMFDDVANTKVLQIKTALGNPVAHNVKPTGAGQEINDGLYFDGLVNMTVFDADDTIPAADLDGAKLGVYLQLKGEDESAGTNFVVVAKTNDTITDGKYICYNVPDVLAGWHRLTIKAIGNIGTGDTGFVVFVDGNAVNCTAARLDPAGLNAKAAYWNENGNLFVSRVDGDATIKSVAFDGQGSVDELVFTTTAPDFAADGVYIEVKWNSATVETMTIGTSNYLGSAGSAYVMITNNQGEAVYPIAYSWTGKEAYMDGNGSITADNAADPFDLTEETSATAAATFGTKKFETLAGAIGEANLAEADGTLKLLADATDGITIQNTNNKVITLDLGGKNVTDTTAINAKSDVVITNSIAGGAVTGKVISNKSGKLLKITAGTFDGTVDAKESDGDVEIWGGKFLALVNAELASYAAIMPTGKTLIPEEGETGYLVVGDPIVTTWTATVAAAGEHVTLVSITTNDVAVVDPVAAGDYTINADDEVVVTYGLDEGYKLATGSAELVQTLKDAEDARASVSPTAEAIAYDINVTGGTATPATYTVAGATVTLAYTGTPELGKEFDSWMASEGTVNGNTLTIAAGTTGKIDVTPNFKNIQYTITFVSEETGTTVPAATNYTVETTFPFELEDATFEGLGKTFRGWTNETYTTAIRAIDKLPDPLGAITLYAKWEVEANPIDVTKEQSVEGAGDITNPSEKAAMDQNVNALNVALDGSEGVAAWVAKVYGEGNKIPATKLVNTSDDLMAATLAYDLKVMAAPVTITVDNATVGNGFAFTLADNGGDDPVVTGVTKIQQLVKYTAALGTTEFAPSTPAQVAIGAEDDKSFRATFVTGPAAGFMKVDLSVAE